MAGIFSWNISIAMITQLEIINTLSKSFSITLSHVIMALKFKFERQETLQAVIDFANFMQSGELLFEHATSLGKLSIKREF